MIRKVRLYSFIQWLECENRGLAEFFWKNSWLFFRFLDEALAKRG